MENFYYSWVFEDTCSKGRPNRVSHRLAVNQVGLVGREGDLDEAEETIVRIV